MTEPTQANTRNKRYAIGFIIALAVLAVLFGMWFQNHSANKRTVANNTNSAKDKPKIAAIKPPVLKNGTVFPQARNVSAFQLTDFNNQPLTNEKLKGHWTMVFFGFTSCPMVCPTTLSNLSKTYQQLQTAQQQPMPQVLFISVDPERDTPKRMQEYLLSFNKDFIGATSNKEQIDKLAQEMSVLYMKIQKQGAKPDDYNIDHSGTILLLDPAGQLLAIFSPPQNPQELATDLQTIIKHYAGQY